MKAIVSPRTLAFLLLGLLSPVAAANQERQPQNRIQSAPVAQHYLPAPAISLANARVASPDKQKASSDSNSRRLRTGQREGSNREMNRYEVDPQSFLKGLAAASAARRALADR